MPLFSHHPAKPETIRQRADDASGEGDAYTVLTGSLSGRAANAAESVGVVTFVGLSPAIARDVATGRIDWTHAVDSTRELPRRLWARGDEFEDWYVGVRDNTAAASDLWRRVADAHRQRST